MPVVLFNHIQKILLLVVLVAYAHLLSLHLLHGIGQFFLQSQYSILYTLDKFLTLDVEIECHFGRRKQSVAMACGLESQVDHRFNHALIDDAESLIRLYLFNHLGIIFLMFWQHNWIVL